MIVVLNLKPVVVVGGKLQIEKSVIVVQWCAHQNHVLWPISSEASGHVGTAQDDDDAVLQQTSSMCVIACCLLLDVAELNRSTTECFQTIEIQKLQLSYMLLQWYDIYIYHVHYTSQCPQAIITPRRRGDAAPLREQQVW